MPGEALCLSCQHTTFLATGRSALVLKRGIWITSYSIQDSPILLLPSKTMTVKCVPLLFFKFICIYIFIQKYICKYLLCFYFKRYIRYTLFYCFVHLCWQSFHSVINNSLFFFKQLLNIPYCRCSISSNASLTSFGMIVWSSLSLSDSQDSLN